MAGRWRGRLQHRRSAQVSHCSSARCSGRRRRTSRPTCPRRSAWSWRPCWCPAAAGRVRGLAGLLVGTVGTVGEWGWTHVWMPIPWPSHFVGSAIAVAVAAALCGALVGAFVAGVAGPGDGRTHRSPAVGSRARWARSASPPCWPSACPRTRPPERRRRSRSTARPRARTPPVPRSVSGLRPRWPILTMSSSSPGRDTPAASRESCAGLRPACTARRRPLPADRHLEVADPDPAGPYAGRCARLPTRRCGDPGGRHPRRCSTSRERWSATPR